VPGPVLPNGLTLVAYDYVCLSRKLKHVQLEHALCVALSNGNMLQANRDENETPHCHLSK